MKKILSVILAAFFTVAVLGAQTVFAQQGQWGGFIYLFAKDGAALSDAQKEKAASALREDMAQFHNDFTPAKDKLETILFLKSERYDLNGAPVSGRTPRAIIRIESLNRAKVDGFYAKVSSTLKDFYDFEYRLSVGRELNYTDKATLARLKEMAPKRGDGNAQPNGVVFPLSKTAAWWAMPTGDRQPYFFENPQSFGDKHLGHNGVGFLYIQKIFRKLYHSRFDDAQQDFMTYFEYADADAPVFDSLLNGLRDKTKNQEWKFVEENPIAWCKRKPALQDIL
jgi:hypothetical protein